jgi:transcriptional regulator with XRE-family HTH domain
MPAAALAISTLLTAQLAALGGHIRAQRKQLKVSAASAAESAGMSRATLHRIERGEASVTMGAYLSAISALGLALDLTAPSAALTATPASATEAPALPHRLNISDYPQLQRLAWQRHDGSTLSPQEALNLYERNWRHVDHAALLAPEKALVQTLVARLGGGRLLV